MASSITMPTASVRPSIEDAFNVMPKYSIAAKVEMIEVGIAIAAMIVARKLRINRNTTSEASSEPRIKCSCTR